MCSCCCEIPLRSPERTKANHARLSLNMPNGAMGFYVFVLVQCFWRFASYLESQHIFSTSCRLEKKRLQGQSEDFMSPCARTHTNTHTRACKDTGVHSGPCPRVTSSHGCFHMCTWFVNSVRPRVNFCMFLLRVFVTFQAAAQSEINALLSHVRVLDMCGLITSLHLRLRMSCYAPIARPLAKDHVGYNDTVKGISTRMQRVYQLCPNIWFSLRVSEL